MTMIKAEREKMQVVFNRAFPSNKDKKLKARKVAVNDVVIPSFRRRSKKKRSSKKARQHQQIMDCLELPTKQTRELMREVSGLGMEDPVFGLSNHSTMKRRAAKNMPHLYDDMGLDDIPADMRDMLSVCSDPTASVVGELPPMSDIINGTSKPASKHKQQHSEWPTDRLHQSESSYSRDRTRSMLARPQKQPQQRQSPKRSPKKKMQSPFVPPMSIMQLQSLPAKEHINQGQDINTDKRIDTPMDLATLERGNNVKYTAVPPHRQQQNQQRHQQQSEKASSRRWRSLIDAQLKSTLRKEVRKEACAKQEEKSPKREFDPFASQDRKPDAGTRNDLHKSCQIVSWETTPDHINGDNNDNELQIEDVFLAEKVQRRSTKPKHKSSNKLHASDSNLVFNPSPRPQLRTVGGVEGLELNMAMDGFDRTVSGLTTVDDNSNNANVFPEFEARMVTVDGLRLSVPVLDIKTKEPRNKSVADHNGDDNGELELYDLMKSQQSLALYNLEGITSYVSKEESPGSSSHLSYSLDTERDHRHHSPAAANKKDKRISSPRDTTTSKPSSERSSPQVSPRGRNSSEKPPISSPCSDRRQHLRSNKLSDLDDSRLFRHSEAKARQSRSLSLEGKRHGVRFQEPEISNVVTAGSRRPGKGGQGKSKSHDSSPKTAARMLALGNGSLQAEERAEEMRSNVRCLQERDNSEVGAAKKVASSSSTKQKKKSRRPSKQRSPKADFHASMGQLSGGGQATNMRLVGNKSCGDIDFESLAS